MDDQLDGLRALLAQVHRNHAGAAGGAPAAYIPELAAVDPELFAVAACSVDGPAASAGDEAHAFTLQSLSKPFLYGWALDQLGEGVVHAHVGVEPTGQAFDSMIRLEQDSHLPHNPMVNAGAIAVTGLLLEAGADLAGLLTFLGTCAGRGPLGVDVPVWLSEREHGHRNRAIAHLLRYFGVLTAPVDATLDLYFRQCATLVDVRELAVMAGTLANHGRCPTTGVQALSPEANQRVLAVMSTCGLYDAMGRFLFDLGVPAKSGVSGGLIAVASGRLGLAAFSPPIDAAGTSLRARAALAELDERLGLHVFGPRSAAYHPTDEAADLERAIDDALEQVPHVAGRGTVASYAAPLARVDPERCGVAICTVDGTVVARGDSAERFSMQATANAFAYARTTELLGREAVHARVGVEPSGNPFHAVQLDQRSGRPFNPLGNAGAITVAGLAPGADEASRLRGLLEFLSSAAGERVGVDAELLDAEWTAGDRNRAIAALLRAAGCVDDEEAALQLYLQQCCVTVDCVRLARMGALLAAGGRPAPGVTPLLSQRAVRDTLSVMYTCGLHDGSGEFAWSVGIPAKSGVSGAIVAVVPGRMGIAVWSPPVDHRGTSVRGKRLLEHLSASLRLGVFAGPALGATVRPQ
ncbi:glutaminase A [Engelhardtia mirabilis]